MPARDLLPAWASAIDKHAGGKSRDPPVATQDAPILGGWRIGSPDLVVMADETLLDDPQAEPLLGLTASGGVHVNTRSSPTVLRQRWVGRAQAECT